MRFICNLILINFILFLPRYFSKLPKGWNPFRFLFGKNAIKRKLKSFYYSRDLDPFRFSFEYSIVVLLSSLLSVDQNISIQISSILALIVLIFNIYFAVFLDLLKKTPVLRSDLLFLRESISIYKGYFLLIIIAVIVLTSLFYLGFFFLNSLLFSFEPNHIVSCVFLLTILIGGLFKIRRYNLAPYFFRNVFSIVVFLFKSKDKFNSFKQYLTISDEQIQKHNLFKDLELKERPNIHFISLESYGSIVLRDHETYADISDLLIRWNEVFNQSDIYCSSILATPPLFATGTWYSYSTLFFGMTIDSGGQYNTMFGEMQNITKYQSLLQLTKDKGYTNYLLHGIKGDFESTLDFDKLKKNLNYDQLLHGENLKYEGKFLKFMNLQKSVPDQYTLNKGIELAKHSKAPYTLFYCTLNSHWHFDSPLEKEENWQELSNPSYKFKTSLEEVNDIKDRYKISIKYSIDSVFDTILKQCNQDDIFIVYGDHQPTMMTDEKYGKETPFHVFSKNKAFIDSWNTYQFDKGLIPQEGKSTFKFEAFYSAFVNCLNKVYGKDQNLSFPFFKDGVNLLVD